MKRISNFTALLLFLLLFGVTGFSQQMKMTETDLSALLCRNWKIDFVMMNGEKASFPYLADTRMEFKADHTFLETPVTQKSAKGNWKYNSEANVVELFNQDKLIGTVNSIAEKKLVYVPVMNEKAKKIIKSSEMHLIPAD